MTALAPRDLLDQVWEYPLFDALYGRRSRRFGSGFEMAEGPTKYKSERAPVALSDFEEALLVAAGFGFSGSALWDQSRPLAQRAGKGRTFPSTSNGIRTMLFFTNDRGLYVVDAVNASASKLKEVEASTEREKVLALYRTCRKELRQGRLEIPRQVPPLCGHNLWDSNMPGSTLFMPVCDISFSLIGLIAQFVDSRLERFVAKNGRGMNIVDDRHGFRPAGTERFIKSGFLDESNVLPLSHLERQACYFMFSEPASICQNMYLATEAMGIGGWMHCGFLSRGVFTALGFRTVMPKAPALENPVGLDGIFQAYCPPYFANMDEAVDVALASLSPARSSAAESRQSPEQAPYVSSDAERHADLVQISDEGIACTKAICNYIYDTYGRFPGNIDAMHLMWFMQTHHLDIEYYDRFYRRGAYGHKHAAHMAEWHP